MRTRRNPVQKVAMKLKLRRRSVYIGTLVAMVAMIGGLAVAITVNSFTAGFPQSAGTANPVAPTGVSYVSTYAEFASATSPSTSGDCAATNFGTATVPNALTAGSSVVICLNTGSAGAYAASDLIQTATVSWGTSAAAGTTFEVDVYFGGTNAMSTPQSTFVSTPGTISATATAVFVFDLTTTSATSVTSISVIVSECTGSSCP